MSDNPFSEPEDDRTIIRPKPGGRRTAVSDPSRPAPAAPPTTPIPPQAPPAAARPAPMPPPPRPAAPPPPPPPAAEPPPIFDVGTNPLAATAEPIVLLIARLWNAPEKPFSGDLRASAIAALRLFEQRAREAGVPKDQLRPAHYALCAALDDVVMNTPWGGAAGWDAGTLAAGFHGEQRSGERFFDQLNTASRQPDTMLPVIELMYVCLSLGFMGGYRSAPDGAASVERVRHQTHDLIMRTRPVLGPDLSAHWQGVAAPYVPHKARLPVWVIASAALAMIAGLFAVVMTGLNSNSDEVYARMLAAPPAAMPQIVRAAIIRPPPPAPPAPEPTTIDRLRLALKAEIERNEIAVLGTDSTAILRINTSSLFAPESAAPKPALLPLLERVGAVLKAELAARPDAGSLQVNAYTDNQPVRTVKFPSNFKLSAARAEAARDLLQRGLGKPPAIAAEGRADADPIAANTTAEGRDINRRLEIVLRRQG